MRPSFLSFLLLTVLLLATTGCSSPDSTEQQPPATTGSLMVHLGFGAGSNSGGQCTGSGQLSISSADGTVTHESGYAYSGIIKTTAPACTTLVMFTDLKPGRWRVQVRNGASCAGDVVAGNLNTSFIQDNVCQTGWR